MPVQILKDRYSSKVGTVVLGATPEQGGTRAKTVTVGGETTLPFLHYEGEIPNKPIIAIEIVDKVPDWSSEVLAAYGDAVNDPAQWAKAAVAAGAEIVFVRLLSADPEQGASSPEKCIQTVKAVLNAVDVPIAVIGCGIGEIDNKIIPAVAEACAGENLLLGYAEPDNYNTIAAACMVHKHTLIAHSPLDINICKQLNILITEMGLSAERIVIDPSLGGLGYGIEYAYSIQERSRLGALQGDKMLGMPVVGSIGAEAWKAKEANALEDEFPAWGDVKQRGVLWEAMTASALLQSGMGILVMRHPEAIKLLKKNIDELMVKSVL